ncbi:MAG TPA: GDSL-type esterase/lipase family protein [Polyangiaceae bacterium]|nr:GDSL-type esterase/lipase family protein [Polyangiaceae bacterium]
MPPAATEPERPSGPWFGPKPFTSRAWLAVCTVLGLALLVEYVPFLAQLRILHPVAQDEAPARAHLDPAPAVGEAKITSRTETRSELSQPDSAALKAAQNTLTGKQQAGDVALPAIDAAEPPLPLADPGGQALTGFFRALTRTAQRLPEAVTRIAHFGDSIVVSDLVSGTLRRKLQAEFGDAGHGFMLIANAWPAYFHNDVSRFATAGWSVSRIVGPYAEDGLYGLGGVSFKAERNTVARFGTAKSGPYGKHVARFVLDYLEDPNGGTLQVSVDGVPRATLDTRGPLKKSAHFTLHVPDGEHEFELYTKTGVTRAFGVVLERNTPGVVVDAIGVQGARIRFLDKADDAHWAEQLRFRKPDLLIYQFGANESGDGFLYSMADYHRTMKEVIAQGQHALPESSCLVIGAMDRAAKVGDEIVSMRVIPSIVEEQRRAAAELGCAFFDTYTAMGGARSMPTWVRRGLGQADLTHPTAIGSEVIGNWVYRALMKSYNAQLVHSPPQTP